MKKTFLMASMLCVMGGCAFTDIDQGAAKGVKPVVIVADSLAKAEPVIAAIEEATGKTIDPVVAAKGEVIANKAQAVANTGAGIATALGQPGIGALLAGLAALAGGVGSFFSRRRAKNIALAASRAADKSDKGGAKLMAEAARLGVADTINSVYRENKE